MWGNTLVVGAKFEDSPTTTPVNGTQGNDDASDFPKNLDAGAAYVFERDFEGNWTQTAYLKAFNSDARDYFGGAVAIHGDTTAIGAINEDTFNPSDDGTGQYDVLPAEMASQNNAEASVGSIFVTNTGAVYLFNRNSQGEWAASGFISGYENDKFLGDDIALDEKTMIIGIRQSIFPEPAIPASGRVLRYTGETESSAWVHKITLLPDDPLASNSFGETVSLFGDRIAIGAAKTTLTTMTNQGAVYLFDCDPDDVCTQAPQILNPNGDFHEYFGSSLSLGNGILAIGAYG